MYRYFFIIIIFFFAFCDSEIFSQKFDKSGKIIGITIDNIDSLDEILKSISSLPIKPVTRIVFADNMSAQNYQRAVHRLNKVSFIMGEIADSYSLKSYSLEEYKARTADYLNTLNDEIDIWEIGNEVNGEWCGNSTEVTEKINSAFHLVKGKNKLSALTLYYNKGCNTSENDYMFTWIENNLSGGIKDGLDYVLVSYYEDDCNDALPDWNQVFDSLHIIFPNAKLGIGECGTTIESKKPEFMERYYKMEINTPNFIGGYFWWYFREDCVPDSKPLWGVLSSIISGTIK